MSNEYTNELSLKISEYLTMKLIEDGTSQAAAEAFGNAIYDVLMDGLWGRQDLKYLREDMDSLFRKVG